MAKIEDLVARITDGALRAEIAREVSKLKQTRNFGLVFEEHIPEVVPLAGLPVTVGELVQRRDDPTRKLFRVRAVEEGTASLESLEGDKDPVNVETAEVQLVKRVGEAIYPALKPIGSIQRGAPDRSHHAVINGENYQALELLSYIYQGQVDCIYLDPPYNTGARDWKYNNRYVDDNDNWRHSKWLAFMEKRLKLARQLLTGDGVLVVTIDEHEVHHLGMLLEKLFPAAYTQMVTIVINPKGVTQPRFSRVEEYAFFTFFGNSKVHSLPDDLLTPGADEEAQDDRLQRPRWKGLLRSGTNARPHDRKNMVYPIAIDPERRRVMGVGRSLREMIDSEEVDGAELDTWMPDRDMRIDGFPVAWPIRSSGEPGNWGLGRETLLELARNGTLSVGSYQEKRQTWALSYLTTEAQKQIRDGVLEVIGRDDDSGTLDVAYVQHKTRRVKTVWHRSIHDAGAHGSDLIRSFLGDRRFSFPKSLYAVKDCLAAVTAEKPDALIVDVFAGSGTTLHATMLLNHEDGGRRRCIMVTNNEVDEETASRLKGQGHRPGDDGFEGHGIFHAVTKPRIEAAVTGRRTDGKPVPGVYLQGTPFREGFEENVEFFDLTFLDPDQVRLGRQYDAIVPTLWLAAGGVGPREAGVSGAAFSMPKGSTYAVLFREACFREFLEGIDTRPDISHAFLVTNSEDAYAEMVADLPARIQTSMLYSDYLRNFRINDIR
ncbi:MAG: DNA methyltransferase [Gemmatimonadota bacterium]